MPWKYELHNKGTVRLLTFVSEHSGQAIDVREVTNAIITANSLGVAVLYRKGDVVITLQSDMPVADALREFNKEYTRVHPQSKEECEITLAIPVTVAESTVDSEAITITKWAKRKGSNLPQFMLNNGFWFNLVAVLEMTRDRERLRFIEQLKNMK